MVKKRKKKQSRKAQSEQSQMAPRPTENMMNDLTKFLAQQNFESIDDVNAFMQNLVNSGQPIPQMGSQTPLDRAQDLMYDAWEERSNKKRIALAKQALEISPDCADAYTLLAEETSTSLKEASEYYQKAVEAGKRALGEQAFQDDVGHFWGIIETRPYMRARAGLARALWQLGEKVAAIEHYRDMLRLNPNDNQGIRYLLVDCLLDTDDHEAVHKLLKQYDDDASPNWTYSWAIHLFRTEGATEAATQRIDSAIEWNHHVPNYLLGRKHLPKRLPPYVTFGGEDEAQHYAAEAKALWQRIPGALDWLKQVVTDRQET